MTKAKFNLSEEQLSDTELSEFETKLNITLPENYKKLIKKYNGGVVKGIEDLRILSSVKYGPNTIEDYIRVHQGLEDNISKDYLPFASDVSGNPICINIKQGEDYGKIYIIYMDSGELDPVQMCNTLEELFGVGKIEDL